MPLHGGTDHQRLLAGLNGKLRSMTPSEVEMYDRLGHPPVTRFLKGHGFDELRLAKPLYAGYAGLRTIT